MLKEFKKFISRGNVLDLAVGVIIGAAFGKIVSSMVDDILMPIIGMFSGGIDFSTLKIVINDTSINYGLFIQNILDFLIIAFCIFLIVKFANKLHINTKKEEEKKKSEEVVILEEIRDTLKKKQNKKH